MKGFKKQSIYIKSQGVLKDRPSGRGLALASEQAGLPEVPGWWPRVQSGSEGGECVHERAPSDTHTGPLTAPPAPLWTSRSSPDPAGPGAQGHTSSARVCDLPEAGH